MKNPRYTCCGKFITE